MGFGVLEALLFYVVPGVFVGYEKMIEMQKCSTVFATKHLFAKVVISLFMAATPIVNIFVALMYGVIRVCRTDKIKKE